MLFRITWKFVLLRKSENWRCFHKIKRHLFFLNSHEQYHRFPIIRCQNSLLSVCIVNQLYFPNVLYAINAFNWNIVCHCVFKVMVLLLDYPTDNHSWEPPWLSHILQIHHIISRRNTITASSNMLTNNLRVMDIMGIGTINLLYKNSNWWKMVSVYNS